MRSVKHLVQFSAGIVLIAVGIPIFVLPIPVGIFVIAAGIFLLVRSWPRARFARIRLRQRYPDLFQKLDNVGKRFTRAGRRNETPP